MTESDSSRLVDSDASGGGADEELLRYLKSRAYQKRARRLQRELLARMDRGEEWTFDEIAERLKLPLAVVLSSFSYSFEQAYGVRLVPVTRVRPPQAAVH